LFLVFLILKKHTTTKILKIPKKNWKIGIIGRMEIKIPSFLVFQIWNSSKKNWKNCQKLEYSRKSLEFE